MKARRSGCVLRLCSCLLQIAAFVPLTGWAAASAEPILSRPITIIIGLRPGGFEDAR